MRLLKFPQAILLVFLSIPWILSSQINKSEVEVIVLGNVQDAGYPQLGCVKSCCNDMDKAERHMVSSLAVYNRTMQKWYLLDASPDITAQLRLFRELNPESPVLPEAIFLTHAHIGHYTGLMYLGKESAGTTEQIVYAMPRMKDFLMNNGPWDILVDNSYIKLHDLKADSSIPLGTGLSVTPLLVPHRDEYSETVGFMVTGPSYKLLFIPDIDKWEKWDRNILELIKEVDFAFLDGTFYDGKELPGRDMSKIPHPFIIESMELFNSLSENERSKIHFIHFNHTNPVLHEESEARKLLRSAGYRLAQTGAVIKL